MPNLLDHFGGFECKLSVFVLEEFGAFGCVAAMDSFLDNIKHSVVEGLKNLALEALHLNDQQQQEDNNADDPRPRPAHSAAPSRSDWRHESAAGGGSNSWDSAGIQEPEARYESWNHGPGGGGAVQESHYERRRPPAAADSWAQVSACFLPLGVLPFGVVSLGTCCRCRSPELLFFKCSCCIIALRVPVLLDLWIFTLQKAPRSTLQP